MLFDVKASDMINKGVEREVSTKCTTVTLEDIVDITDKMEQSLDKKRTRFPDGYKGRFHSGTPLSLDSDHLENCVFDLCGF